MTTNTATFLLHGTYNTTEDGYLASDGTVFVSDSEISQESRIEVHLAIAVTYSGERTLSKSLKVTLKLED
jgi:hypothetical protein